MYKSTRASIPRAALYLRVSSRLQEDEGTSLQSQEERCRAFAAERGFTVAPEHVYTEVHTGVELWERPILTAMRQAARANEFDIVIAYSIDRLSRDPVHLGVILSEADHAGVDDSRLGRSPRPTPPGGTTGKRATDRIKCEGWRAVQTPSPAL